MSRLKTEQEYKEAYERLYTLAFGKETFTTDEINEIERLKNLIDVYQKENVHIPKPTPLEAIKFRVEQEDQSTYKIELTYAELSDLCGIVSLYWVENNMNLDYVKALSDKLAKMKNEIITKNLN